ncbi:unnamed protein product [Notodromas monacha]|uniref:U11/U12 small nuclear ribonucleoprotein 35 kDa protein n=1 Tax=Notodromas monacha TaxID=399045 RepID=A0A7R9BFR5_9CRUS|nr:unnamed protein product [Notodromas monacha]CAG0913808.1 unnamed protein product [Notodromas monacha]
MMPRYLNPYDPLKAGSIDCTDDVPHDKAVERAIQNARKYKPVKYRSSKRSSNSRLDKSTNVEKISKDPSCTVMVARLNPNTTENKLQHELSRYGKVCTCRVVRDLVTGMSKMYAMVEFETRADAKECYKRAHESIIDDRRVIVDWEFGRTLKGWVPRRLGEYVVELVIWKQSVVTHALDTGGGFGGKRESGQLRFGCRVRPHRRPID